MKEEDLGKKFDTRAQSELSKVYMKILFASVAGMGVTAWLASGGPTGGMITERRDL
jgi:hypothetical protein